MPSPVLPFYLVCDESYSMTDHLETLNNGLRELRDAVRADPGAGERTRFCLIGFAESARVIVALGQFADLAPVTGLTVSAATNYGEVFTVLRRTIEEDVAALLALGHQVHQPAVFFLSDGQPTDPAVWPRAFHHLVDPDWPARPKVIAFGVGDADPATIAQVGTYKSYLGVKGTTPGAAVRRFADALTDAVVASRCTEPLAPDPV